MPRKAEKIIGPINAELDDIAGSIVGAIKTEGVVMTTREEPQNDKLIWTKKMSLTDAQKETSGGIVPYLRLTKSSLKEEDFQTWFRTKFFKNLTWVNQPFGREVNVEQSKVIFAVTFSGTIIGDIPFKVTHGSDRWEKHNTPNTWIHWPPKMQELLELNDMSGESIVLERTSDGLFYMALGD